MTTLAIELRMVSAQTVKVTEEALIVDLSGWAYCVCAAGVVPAPAAWNDRRAKQLAIDRRWGRHSLARFG